MKTVFQRFIADEDGASAIEYGLIAALISVVIVGAVSAVGTNLNASFEDTSNKLEVAMDTGEMGDTGGAGSDTGGIGAGGPPPGPPPGTGICTGTRCR